VVELRVVVVVFCARAFHGFFFFRPPLSFFIFTAGTPKKRPKVKKTTFHENESFS